MEREFQQLHDRLEHLDGVTVQLFDAIAYARADGRDDEADDFFEVTTVAYNDYEAIFGELMLA